ncbi:MAG: hypothetical protein LWW98_10220, partial [Deltaproteobacteria bacterium]|nr:hypothetical protein [Deltaproteobacteria bacterium]
NIASVEKTKKKVMEEIHEEVKDENFNNTPLVCVMDGALYLWALFKDIFKDIENKVLILDIRGVSTSLSSLLPNPLNYHYILSMDANGQVLSTTNCFFSNFRFFYESEVDTPLLDIIHVLEYIWIIAHIKWPA